MKTFSQFQEEINLRNLRLQEEIDFFERELSNCEYEYIAEGIRDKLKSLKKRAGKIATTAALGAALSAGGGAAQAKTHTSGNVNVTRGPVAAKTTDAKTKSAVSGAIKDFKSGKGGSKFHSASSEKGKTKTTVSGGINVSGKLGGSGSDRKEKKEKKEKQQQQQQQQSNRKYRSKAEVLKQRAERQAELNKKNKFKTKYRYAVPTQTGGRFNTSQASGPNKVSSWKPVGTNKTGGRNFQRTKIVGDPTGSGSTGRTVGPKKYDKLFGKGGKFTPKGDGSTTYVPNRVGKKYNPN